MNDLKKCPACSGSGRVIDDEKMGRSMRKLREQSGVGVRELARRLGVSHTYLINLESARGYCHWTTALVASFKAAVKAISEARPK